MVNKRLRCLRKINILRIYYNYGYENKEKYAIYVSKKYCEEKHVALLLIGEGEKKTLCSCQIKSNGGRKHFYRNCLHAFVTDEILKCHIKQCFQINDKQTINMPNKDKYIKFKNFETKIKSPFMI